MTCKDGEELPLFVKESSIAALEMALTIAHDLMRMEKTVDILKLDRMPLTAVILYKKVGLAAILLGEHYGRDTETLLREVIQMLSERISRRWKIARGFSTSALWAAVLVHESTTDSLSSNRFSTPRSPSSGSGRRHSFGDSTLAYRDSNLETKIRLFSLDRTSC